MSTSERPALKRLPVAETADVMDRLVRMVAAVRPQEVEEVRALADRLLAGQGPALRERLVVRAEAEDAAGRNWMSGPWLQGYFAERRPLPLSTNVVFQVALGRDQPGGVLEDPVLRAADVIRRAGAVHLAEARGQTVPPVDARGSAIDPAQFACLNGGLREPGAGVDSFRAAEPGAARRELGLFVDGRLFAVPLTHDDGRLLGRAELASAVGRVVKGVPGSEDASEGPAFGAISALGSERLAELMPALLAEEENAATYERLRQMLFTVTLVDGVAEGAGCEVAETVSGGQTAEAVSADARAILRGLTDPSLVWAYRPVSYLHRLADGWTAMHVEHSTVDGATLVEAVRRMQDTDQADEADGNTGGLHEPVELRWSVPPALAARVEWLLEPVARRAAELRVDVVRTRRPDVEAAGMKVSVDAVQQLVMALAQRIAFGRVRGHYESVDMREHQAGRTECLRPVTPELVVLVDALAGDVVEQRSAGEWRQLLVAALDAHRDWVKACKAGGGVDRHLFGLQWAAAEPAGAGGGGSEGAVAGPDGMSGGRRALEELTAHPGVQAAREDFLSTTSIGSAAQVVRYAFVPSVQDGFGVAYTPGEGHLEFTVSHWAGEAVGPERFLGALGQAADRVDAVLRRAGAGV